MQRFEDSLPDGRASATHPPFSGDHFVGVGRVLSIASDSSSVLVELVDPMLFEAYGATRVTITPQTNFDYTETIWALVAANGVARAATELPLAPGAPAIGDGERITLQCRTSSGGIGTLANVAKASPAGASSWTLEQPLALGFPGGTLVSYDRSVHVARFADLELAAGQSVLVELSGTPADYAAIRLTNVLLRYR